ncbi:MAG: hypothetical protein EOP11_10240 [Proteobacteria bacterium]|nr:MAG: hypothetical protein EOP11_10240 [Pseudomonadota bacterium]
MKRRFFVPALLSAAVASPSVQAEMVKVKPVAENPANPAPSPAGLKELTAAKTALDRGGYPYVIQTLSSLHFTNPAEEAQSNFLLATAHAKLQAFDRALPHYKSAIRLNSPAPSLPYDYGQALFATQALAEAEEQFKISIVNKYKVAASGYYVGYLRQLQENYAGAADFYRRIQRLDGDEDKVKQPALFQLAELEYEKAQRLADPELKSESLRMTVLLLYEAARDFAEGTPAAKMSAERIAEITRATTARAERMANGIPLPLQPFSLRLAQEIGFDSNVITQADDALVEVSGKDSPFSRTSAFGRYQWNFWERFSLTPELYAAATFYGRRSEPRVFQNDNIVLAPALRSKWEHTSRGAPATALFDIEFNYMLRDYPQDHSLPFYSRFWNFSLGERVKWFDTGTTTLRLAFKLFENYDPRRNSLSPAFSLQQNVRIFNAFDLQNTFSADYFRARDDQYDETNYRLRQAVSFPRLFERVDFLPSLSLQAKDTMKQSYFRGTEILINPAILFTRPFAKQFEASLEYGFSKNFSKSDDQFQYTKHEARVGIAYTL